MTKLTLPIVVGKKYVRRDGVVITVEARNKFVTVFADNENRTRYPFRHMAFPCTGRINSEGEPDTDHDLVADYIEPAKGHPHAAAMALFAEDAARVANPISLWQYRAPGRDWEDFPSPGLTAMGTPGFCAWYPDYAYRRKPTITPDPHAQSAAEYAKDMAATDKAWGRWESKGPGWKEWQSLAQHPSWYSDFEYRRKEQA